MERVSLDDWERVVDELRRFAGGEVNETDEGVRVDFGSAHLAVTRDGRLSTGMPLHEFESTGAVTLAFDHAAGELHVEAPDVEYTFRRP